MENVNEVDAIKLPESYDSVEEALLGIFMQEDSSAAYIAQSGLCPEHFTKKKNQLLFSVILSVRIESGIASLDLIANACEKTKIKDSYKKDTNISVLDYIGGAEELTRVLNTPQGTDLKYAEAYTKLVFEQYRLSRVQVIGDRFKSLDKFDEESIAKMATELQSVVMDSSLDKHGLVSIDTLLTDAYKRFENRKTNPEDYLGLQTGFYYMDKYKAIAKKRTCIIGAGTSHGKCLHPDTLIYTSRGLKKISSILVGDHVQTSSGNTHIVSAIHRTMVDEGYHITTEYGFEIIASPDHKFLTGSNTKYSLSTIRGITEKFGCSYSMAKKALHCIREKEESISVGVNSIIHKINGVRKHSTWKPARELNIGDEVFFADSHNTFGNKRILNAYWLGLLIGDGGLSIRDRVSFTKGDKQLLDAFKSPLPCYSENTVTDNGCVTITICSRSFREFLLNAYGIPTEGVRSNSKTVPKVILESDRETQIEFLRGIFDTDGYNSSNLVEYSTASEVLSKEVQLLLLNFGILSKRHTKTINGVKYYLVWINGAYYNLFHDTIGFSLVRKRNLKRLKRYNGIEKVADRIVSIEKVKGGEYCDLTVDTIHDYVANGLITHNSIITQGITSNLLKHGHSILVFTPELDKDEYVDRMICSCCDIPIDDWKAGSIGSSELARASKFIKDIIGKYGNNLYVEDRGVQTSSYIINSIRKHMFNHPVDVVVVDYLQKLKYYGEPKKAMTDMSGDFYAFGKDNNIATILVSQLRRKLDSKEDITINMLKECVVGSTQVIKEDGSIARIDSIKEGDRILASNQIQRVVPLTVNKVWCTGMRKVFKVTTRTGKEVTVTNNHPFLTPEKWNRLEYLKVGDIVGTSMLAPISEDKKYDSLLDLPEEVTEYLQSLSPNTIGNTGKVSRDIVRSVNNKVQDAILEIFANSDILWEEIVSIEPVGEELVYDLSMEKHHNFIGNNIFLHNSGDLENFADSVILVSRNSITQVREKNKGYYIIAKNRQGSTTDKVELEFNDLTLKFTETEVHEGDYEDTEDNDQDI
jgi:intein/homing endonuclease